MTNINSGMNLNKVSKYIGSISDTVCANREMDTVVVVVAAVRIETIGTITIPKQQGNQREFCH